jgi:peptide/nickel transport system permease protein
MELAGERSPARREWLLFMRRLARRRTALFGLVVVLAVVVAALGAPWLSAYDPVEQDITNRLTPPGSVDAPAARICSAPITSAGTSWRA